MSLLIIGLSHRTAPIPLLEQVALRPDQVDKLLGDAVGTEHVDEAIAVATCNRLEVYADVTKFHGALADLSELVSHYTGVSLDELTGHFYVHYDNRAVQHLFTVACGLDSMVLGEPQVLGQLRAALASGQAGGTAGRVLNDLAQTALRVGKRAHSETGLDRAGQSLVTAALELAAPVLPEGGPARAVVVGAGSMSSLAATTLARLHPGLDLAIANRSLKRAERLAAAVGGRAVPLDEVGAALEGADLVVSCTGAAGTVLTADVLGAARPRAVVDLALPRDVAPEVGALPGVTLIDLEVIADAEREGERVEASSVEAARRIVADEVAAYDAAQRAATVAPTVAALRGMAAVFAETELARFDARVPGLDPKTRAEVANTVRRVVDKLLHEPTVRVKQLAADPGGTSYAVALRELFNLDPAAAAAVSRAEPIEEPRA
ncbi:MAG TPA: glutamyl-tRNA reductase [Actinocrinis sp.]|nr:glutamyl-tRNA reductase [Actinocrinis sp.]